jgi:hypothetical protein
MAWILRKSGERSAIVLALTLYATLLAYAIPRHEPWADEAQAWELASSLSLKSLFQTYIHYECSGGLWHTLLWLLSRLHVTYAGMHWITGLIALTGMALLTFLSPLPFVIRLLLPFTYFFSFQYSIVARSYALFPVLLFALAHFWPLRQASPLPIALLIGLLANVSVHGLAIAFGLTIVLAIEWLRIPHPQRANPLPSLPSALLLIAMISFAAWCVMPAPDASWAAAAKYSQSHDALALSVDSSSSLHPWVRSLPFSLAVATTAAFRFANVLSQGLFDHFNLGLILWILLLWRWKRNGLLRYSIPVLLLAVLCTFTPFKVYHAGLLWLLFLFLWSITWHGAEQQLPQRQTSTAHWTRNALLFAVIVCIVEQSEWTNTELRYDASMPYSPDRDGAVVLRTYLDRGYKVDVAVPSSRWLDGHGQFYAVGLEPYFSAQPIANMPYRFWFWGSNEPMRAKYLSDSENHSAVVLVEETAEDKRYEVEETYLTSIGYRADKTVCGQIIYPHLRIPPVCHAFYVPPNKHGQLL